MADLTAERARVAEEERTLQLPRFTDDDAWAIGLALVERGRARHLPIAVDVARGDHVLFHAALPGAAPHNAAWIERKKRAVRRWLCSSYALALKLQAEGRTLADSLGPVAAAEYGAAGGCFPLVVRDAGLVGTVAVSGLSQREDHDLVVEVLREHLARP